MDKNPLIAAIAKRTGFAPEDVRAVLRALNEVAMADEPMTDSRTEFEVARFWACWWWGVEQGHLVDGVHHRTDENRLALRWGAAYKVYLLAHRELYGRAGNSNTYQLTLMRQSKAFLTMKASYWIGDTKSSAMVFLRAAIPTR